MKKKLIQVLMLMVAAVSIGTFMSCKDTNEDLYNELRQETTTSDESLIQKINQLEANIEALNNALKPCTCDPTLGQQVETLTTLVNSINAMLGGEESGTGTGIGGAIINYNGGSSGSTGDNITLEQLFGDIAYIIEKGGSISSILNQHGQDIMTLLSFQTTANEQLGNLQDDLNKLQQKVDAIKSCECDFTELWEAVHEVETGVETVKAKAENALQIANEAKGAVAAVEEIARKAQETANNAATAAATAGENAKKAQETADAAKELAETANNLAEGLKSRVEAIEEKIKVLDGIDARITTVEGKAAEALQKAIDADAKASTNAQAIADLEPRVKANEDAIAALKGTVGILQTKFGELETQVGTNTDEIATLKTTLTTLNATVTGMSGKVETLLTDVSNLKNDLAQAKADCAANLAEAKTYADTQIAAAIATAKSEIMADVMEELAKYYTNAEIDDMLKNLKDELTISIEGNTLKIEGLDGRVGTIETTVGSNTTRIEAIEEALKEIKSCGCDEQALKNAIEAIKTQLQGMWTNQEISDEISNKISEAIANLVNTTIKDMQDELGELDGKVGGMDIILQEIKDNYISAADVQTITDAIIAKAEADSADFKNRMDIIGDSIKNVVSDLASLESRVAVLESSNFVTHDEIANFASKDDIAGLASKDELAELQNTLVGRIDANDTKISSLETTVTTITGQIQTLQNDYNALKGRMDTAEEKLNTVLEDVSKLKSDVAAIQDYLAKQVSSIIVQGTYNPMFGSFSLPTGSQSNILLAFYGLPSTDVEFPTSRTSNYVRAEEALTEKDMEMLGIEPFMWPANAPLMYDKGYAGKIYMTINPNTADVSGLQPKIVNSADEDSYITLTPIQPSTEKLQFGWTRADQSSNGFYEAEARVKPTDVAKINAPSFNTSAMLDAAKNVRDALAELAESQSVSGTGSKLEKVASDVSTIVKGMRFDRSALKVSYETEDGQGAKTEHSVYSQYDLAATAFQPLNLKTAKDLNFSGIPGFSKVNSLLDKLSNEVHNRVHFFFKDFNNSTLVEKLVNLQINNIEVPEISEDMLAEFILHMDTTFVMDGLSYHLVLPIEEDIPIKIDKNLTIPIDIEGVEFEVPVHFEQDVDVDVTVDLSELYITTPFIQVTDNEGNLVTKLVIPIINNETGELEGYTTIPMENFKLTTTIDADNTSQAGQKIYLEGEALATATTNITIDDIVSGTVDIHKDVYYNLVLEETFHFSTTIDKWFYFGDNGTDKKSFNLVFSYDMTKSAKDLWGMAADALGNVNEMLDDVRDILDEINNALAEINKYEDKITSTFDNVLDKVRTYLDKINSKVTNFINSTNDRFQPFMVASTDKGMKRLSGSKGYPTRLAKDIKLYATSQTMELFVPLARKHVAVTNVFKGSASAQGGNADCKSKLNAANGSGEMNKVIDGNVREVALNGLVKGYVYEIAYSALDFQGNIATRKYYVTVE